jgi:hypothetical protein
MNVDEVQALEIAISALTADKSSQPAQYWIDLEDGYWQVGATDRVAWINAGSGQLVGNLLSPLRALAAAKLYAQANSLGWKPSFTLELKPECWIVGSCRSQLGGQTYVYVSHDGNVARHSVNHK